MKKVNFIVGIIGFAAVFSSCTREIPISKSEDTYTRTNESQLTGAQKAIQIFNNFLSNLNKDNLTTKSSSNPQIVKINKSSAFAYINGGEVATKASNDNDMTFYELTLKNSDQTSGYAIVADDSILSDVIAYSPFGSIADTALIPGMADYFQAMSEYFTNLKLENAKSTMFTTQTTEYWQTGMAYSTVANSSELLKSYPTYAEFLAAGGVYYDAKPADKTITWTCTVPVLWDQGAPYNDKVPVMTANEGRCRVGCFAVAVGQLMAYWKKPTKYDWNVVTQYKSLTTTSPVATKDKVSTLLYDIARAGNTKFKPEKMLVAHLSRWLLQQSKHWAIMLQSITTGQQ